MDKHEKDIKVLVLILILCLLIALFGPMAMVKIFKGGVVLW